MKALNITSLRKLAQDKQWSDQWWFSVNGNVCQESAKLVDLPREGEVAVMNVTARGTSDEEWILFRYPSYKAASSSSGKRKKRGKPPTIKQVIALEYFGVRNIETKFEAATLLDDFFAKHTDYTGFQEYFWQNLQRMHSGLDLYREALRRLQIQKFEIKENTSKHLLEQIAMEANASGISHLLLLDLICKKYPQILLAESTRLRKQGEYRSRDREWRAYKQQEMANYEIKKFFAGVMSSLGKFFNRLIGRL